MKRLSCFVLALILALGTVQVFAAETEGLRSAIETVKGRLDIPAELSSFDSNTYIDNDVTVYELNWKSPADAKEQGQISVTVNMYGDIIGYYDGTMTESYDGVRLPKLNSYEAAEAAAGFLARTNPGIAGQFTYEYEGPQAYGSTYSIRLYRYINGMRYCGDMAYFGVDKQSGTVKNMNVHLTYCDDIVPADSLITPEAAADAFAAISPVKARYVLTDSGAAELVYSPEEIGIRISAVDGTEIKSAEDTQASADNAAYESGALTAGGGDMSRKSALTVEELAELDNIEGLMSIEQLREIADGIEGLGSEDRTFSSCSYIKRVDDKNNAEYEARLIYDCQDGVSAVFELDAMSGELLSYHGGIFGKDESKLTYEEGEKLARDFAQRYGGEEFAQCVAETADESGRGEYSYTYTRVVNGFEFESDYIAVWIGFGGEVTGYNKSWDNASSFESPDGIITAEQAHTALMNVTGLELNYVMITENESRRAVPVYVLTHNKPVYIDAITGEGATSSGGKYEESTADSGRLTDITGHYAEAYIRALVDGGYVELAPDMTEFRPDAPATKYEAAAFAGILTERRFPEPLDKSSVGSFAGSEGLLEDGENGEEICTREIGIEYIIKVIGLDEAAEINWIYNTDYFPDSADITSGKEGYAALAKGFGIVGGNPDGTLMPQAPLTRADMVIMLYNYLVR